MEMPIPHLALDEGPYDDLLSDSDSGEEDQVDETTEEAARWKFIKPPDVQLNVDNTDAFLLSKARLETARVMQRVLSRVFGAQGGHSSQVATVDVLKLWLDQNVLNIVQQHINANLDAKDFISVPELFGFIEVELWLSFYGISPTTFYSKDYRDLYPPAKQAMRSRRYRSILNALGTKSGQIATSEEFWNAPFEADRSLSHAMDALRRVCSEIGFVSEVSIASLDDDLLRLRSRSVEDIGLTRVRNPKKGFGPVHHGVVSLVTGLYLSGHIASRGETLGEVLKLMMRSLCGVSTDSQIDLSGVLFALDRGYQSKAVNQHIIECGGSVIGTHKRVQAFPFTYGKPAQKSQKLINEVGSMSTNWASYKCAGRAGSDTSSNHMHALAFRSGLGKIVLCSTSDKEAGPGKWSYVPRNRNDKANNDSDAFTAFETRVKLLTELQRTPDWFLMRQFRITGLVAIKLLRSIAQQPCQPRDEGDGQVDIYHVLAGMSTVQLVLQILDFPVAAEEEQRDNDGPVRRPLTSDDLLNKKGNELKQMCHDRGLPAYGTIAVLKERLMGQNTASSRAKTPEQPTSVAATLLQAWFLSPKSSTDMKIGTKNEDNISTHVAAFFAAHSALRVRQTKSYGLLAKSDQSYLAFSPDDVADVVDNTESFYAILEYKTRTKSSTAAAEKEISAKHGMFTSIRLDTGSNGKQFRRLVPDQAHRSQILHNIIIASLRNGFLVYASKTTILRVVHVIISEDVAEAYLLALSTIKDKCLSWIYSPDTPLPNFSAEELGHCVDTATLKQHLSLWRALTTKVETRGRPLPAAHQIVPTVIAKWNRVKGGIDVYSRYLKNVKARHAHLAPLAVIWLRILMTLAYNAYQTTQLLESYSFLMDTDKCKSYSAYQKKKCRNSTLHSFCRNAAAALPEIYGTEINKATSSEEEDDKSSDGALRDALKVLSPSKRSFSYNKRKHFEVDPEWRRIRLSKRKEHSTKLLPGTQQLSCLVCCRVRSHDKENRPRNEAHTRHGNKTRNQCTVCSVPLCNVKCWDGRSCFDVFHTDPKLPNPCEQVPETRAPQIRPPPPTRKRPRNSVEPNERRVTRLTPQPRRYSARLARTKL